MTTPLSLLRQLNSRQRPGIWQTHPLASWSEEFRLRYVAVIAFVTAMGRQTTAAEEEGFGNFCAQLSIATEDAQEQLTMRASLDGATLLDILDDIQEAGLEVHLLLDILWLHISLGKHLLSEQTALSELCLLLGEPARAWEPLAALVQEIRQSPKTTIEASKLKRDQRLPGSFFNEIEKPKINILITGDVGCGKSSTINALFNADKAKVGQGVDPETMEITQYELDNIVLFDSPGLGDGKEADIRRAENITDKLLAHDKDGNPVIDLVLVIMDGSSRDLGTSFELITQVIIPSLGQDTSRLLVAINQADVAMKGRHWNVEKNQPEPPLVEFLDAKVKSTRARIKEATGVDVEPIYYAAGYKDGGASQNPYNLSKLLKYITQHIKKEKHAAFVKTINRYRK